MLLTLGSVVVLKGELSFLGERSRGEWRSARVLAELISLQELVLLQAEEGVGEQGELVLERMKVSRTRGWREGSKATTTRLSQSRSDETGQEEEDSWVEDVAFFLLVGWMEEEGS